MKLRDARTDDAEAVASVFIASRSLLNFLPSLHTATEDRDFIVHRVMAQCAVTVCETGAGIVGFIAESPGWIEHLYLAPEVLRSGIGSSLLNAAKAHQAQLDLWCFLANERGRIFYERNGFVEVERTDGSRNEEKLPDIRYRWVRP